MAWACVFKTENKALASKKQAPSPPSLPLYVGSERRVMLGPTLKCLLTHLTLDVAKVTVSA